MALTAEQRMRLAGLLGGLEEPSALAAALEREEAEAVEAEARAERARLGRIFAKEQGPASDAPEEAEAARERAEAEAARTALAEANERWRAVEAIVEEAWPADADDPGPDAHEVEVLSAALDELLEIRESLGMRRTLGRVASKAAAKAVRATERSQMARLWLEGFAELAVASRLDQEAAEARSRARRSRRNAGRAQREAEDRLVRLGMRVARAVPPEDADAEPMLRAVEDLAVEPLPTEHWTVAAETIAARIRLLWRRELRRRAVTLLGA